MTPGREGRCPQLVRRIESATQGVRVWNVAERKGDAVERDVGKAGNDVIQGNPLRVRESNGAAVC